MNPRGSPSDELVARLLEEIALTGNAVDACSIVLHHLITESGCSRGIAVFRVGDRWRTAGVGVGDEELEKVLAHSPDADSLSALSSRRGSPSGAQPATIPGLDFESCLILPLEESREASVGGGVGAIVLEDTDLPGGSVEFVSGLLRRCGPALIRRIELDSQRERGDHLSRQRDLLALMLETLADPVLLTNGDNDILLANRRANELLAASPDDSRGRRRAIEVNNLLFSSFLTQSVISGGDDRSRELNLAHPADGSDLLFEVFSLSVPWMSSGSTLSVLRDITDLKRAIAEMEAQNRRSKIAELAARQEKDHLTVVLENVSDPILVTDEQSNIILTNREAERLFVAADQGARSDAEQAAVQANDTKFTTLISNFLLQPLRWRSERLELTDPHTGHELPVEVLSSKIVNHRGEPTAIVSVLHDLTRIVENQRLTRELQQLNEELEVRIRRATLELEEQNRRLEWQSRELEKASRLKSEFLANMSHELRTPLNVVLGYTSLIREQIYGQLNDKQAEALAKIYGTSQHLLELINNILDLSKIEAGKMTLHLEDLSVTELLGELSETVVPMVRDGVAYRTVVADQIPRLHTDRTKLKQVLLNLLSNASKFTHTGSITVRATAAAEDRIRIAVEDTGIGIERDQLDAIFEDFRQVDQSHTRVHGGTGLGLSITRKLLGLLGGRIQVSSTYGAGSVFEVELPLTVSLPAASERSGAQTERIALAR